MDQIYADYAAATPVDDTVLAAMQPFWQTDFYNPSAVYDAGRRVRQAIDAARKQVAAILGSRPAEIIFTAGGSEANNLAVNGIMRRFPTAAIAVSPIEHDSVLKAAAQYDHGFVAVTADGILDLPDLHITDQTVLVSVMYANNEIGTIQPIRQLAARLREMQATRHNGLPLYLHVDASQAANYLDLQVNRLGADLLTLNGGKLYGPKQSGALYVRAGVELQPLIHGGGQERGLRSGTESPASCIGFAAALELAQQCKPAEVRRLQALQLQMYQLLASKLPQAQIHGSQKLRLPNNVHFSLPGADNERLVFALDGRGIMAAAGSACAAASGEASHVLAALGLDEATARASLRFTFGRQTTAEHIERIVTVLAELYPSA